MKATELRIGNYLNGKQGPVAVSEIRENNRVKIHDNASSFTVGTCLPFIPLTEEWLLKFGFQKRESSVYNEWYIGKNEITNDWLFCIVWLLKPELINAPNYPFYKNGRHLIQYVHQLQNLFFALTGEELTLNT